MRLYITNRYDQITVYKQVKLILDHFLWCYQSLSQGD